mgnify:FL=1
MYPPYKTTTTKIGKYKYTIMFFPAGSSLETNDKICRAFNYGGSYILEKKADTERKALLQVRKALKALYA